MIESFRDEWLSDYYWNGEKHRSLPATIANTLLRKLDLMHAAASECDLRVPLSNRFERLQGKLTGWCSIRANKQYRLIFQWQMDRAFDVYLDPHIYQ